MAWAHLHGAGRHDKDERRLLGILEREPDHERAVVRVASELDGDHARDREEDLFAAIVEDCSTSDSQTGAPMEPRIGSDGAPNGSSCERSRPSSDWSTGAAWATSSSL